MANSRYDVDDIDELDYCSLIRELSTDERLPCSAHVRNSLLAPFCAAVPHESLRFNKNAKGVASTSTLDPWQVYKDYRRGVQLAAIGNVPDRVRKGDTKAKGEGRDEYNPLWAVVILSPVYAPGWVSHDDVALSDSKNLVSQRIWSGLRLNLWLSTERSLDLRASATSTGNQVLSAVREATSEETDLLRFVVERYLTKAVASYTRARKTLQREGEPLYLPLRGGSDKQAIVDLYAVNHTWVKVFEQWSQEQSTSCALQLRRANPCLSNCLASQEARRLADRTEKGSKRWHIAPLEDNIKQLAMVRDSNNICFPLWYVRNRRHISALVSDGEDGTRSTYPVSIEHGSPAGWAYAHDDLSIASLHVAEPYRRMKGSVARDKGHTEGEMGIQSSVGLMCVAAMARQLVEAQQSALHRSGVEEEHASDEDMLACPLFADTELDKGPARGFFAKFGFTAYSVSTWGAISLDVEND